MKLSTLIFALLFPQIVLAVPAHSEPEVTFDSAAKIPVEANLNGDVKNIFSRAVSQLHDGDNERARASFTELHSRGLEVGYRNFPEFSLALIELARSEQYSNSAGQVSFLLNQARALSPTDARVTLLSSHFYRQVGYQDSLAALFKGVALLFRHPTLVVSFVTEITLVVSFALVVSLLFLTAVQLAVYGGEIVEGLGDLFPRRIWGFAGPALFFVLVSIPLVGGVLCVIWCWSFLLGWFVPKCRWLPSLVAAVALSWGLSLNTFQNTSAYVNSSIENAVEEENNASFGATHEALFKTALERDPSPLTIVPAYSSFLIRQGRLGEAESLIKKYFIPGVTPPPIELVFTSHLGAIYGAEGDAVKAKEFLLRAENLGDTSFENAYLLSQVGLALTDLELQENYYQLAVSRDASRIKQMEEIESGLSAHVQVPLRASSIYPRFMAPVVNSHGNVVTDSSGIGTRIAQTLIRFGTIERLIWFGIIGLGLGMTLKFRTRNARQELRNRIHGERSETISRIWSLIPGGLYVAGRRPILGMIVLSTAIVLFIFAVELPIQLPVTSAFIDPYRPIVLLCSLTIVFGASLASVRKKELKGRGGRR